MKLLVSNQEIVEICKSLGEKITEKFNGKSPIFVCVLKGAVPFFAELIKHIDLDLTIDFIQVSSYVGTESTGNIIFKQDLESDISGQDVVVVEDIVDTGKTLLKLKEQLEMRNPNSLTFVSLLDKPSRREVDVQIDYVGKVIDNLFVVGFGLDYDEKYRNLKDIYYIEN